MFKGKRYATKGVTNQLGLDVQLLLWSLVDIRNEKGIEVDYLQVFELSVIQKDGIDIQYVIHRQECPPAIDSYYVPLIETTIQIRVWVMDCDEYCMMLLPEEY